MNFQSPNSNLQSREPRGSVASCRHPIGNWQLAMTNGFTLIELMVVIAIIGLLAAVGLPAIKGFGKSNTISAADRQMLDAIAEARQRAIAEHTDVYMLFASRAAMTVKTTTALWNKLTLPQQQQVSNVLGKQYTGYSLYAARSVGDQPGRRNGRYLTKWQALPDGIFIKLEKFSLADFGTNSFIDGTSSFQTALFPFPAATNAPVVLPYLKFNHLGQLDGPQDNGGEYIPLARGSVAYDFNLNADVLETPPGNSRTNSTMFNRVRIEGLTGRARVEHYEISQ